MHKYLVQVGDDYSDHFRKYNYFSEVGGYMNRESTNTFKNVSEGAYGQKEDLTQKSYSTGTHVYRIKDIMDAINTSVIIEGKQREEYIQMLSNSQSDLKVDQEFISICRNVGECDTM